MASFVAVVVGSSSVFGVVTLAIAAEIYYMIWWKKKKEPLAATEIAEVSTSSRSLLLKPSSSACSDSGFGVESELMRLHNLSGPPRFLFTIKEETREDLDSEDRSRKGSRTRSLSDVIVTCDTPFLTPIASPRIVSPRLLNHPSLQANN